MQGELERLIMTAQEMLLSPSQGYTKPTPKLPRGPHSKPHPAKAPASEEGASSAIGDGIPATRSPAKRSADTPACRQAVNMGRRRGDAKKCADGSQAGKDGHAGEPNGTRRDALVGESEGERNLGGREAEDKSESGSFCSTRSSPDVQLVRMLGPLPIQTVVLN